MCFLVGSHLLSSTFLLELVDHGLHFRSAEKRGAAKCTGSKSLLKADDFATVQAVGSSGEEWMPCRYTVAFPCCVVTNFGGIGANLQRSDGGI